MFDPVLGIHCGVSAPTWIHKNIWIDTWLDSSHLTEPLPRWVVTINKNIGSLGMRWTNWTGVCVIQNRHSLYTTSHDFTCGCTIQDSNHWLGINFTSFASKMTASHSLQGTIHSSTIAQVSSASISRTLYPILYKPSINRYCCLGIPQAIGLDWFRFCLLPKRHPSCPSVCSLRGPAHSQPLKQV